MWKLLQNFYYISHIILKLFLLANIIWKPYFNIPIATLTLGSQLRQGLARLLAKKAARESHFMLMGMQKSVKEWTFTLLSELPFWELEYWWSFNFQRAISGVKTHGIEFFLYHWKDIKNYMFKMGSHDLFGHLKHKLWPKERLGIKLAVWLLTTKSQESTQFPRVQVAHDILLESFQQGLQLCFRPHCNQRSAHKVMGVPKSRESRLWEFRDSHLGIPRQMRFGCGPHGDAQSIL